LCASVVRDRDALRRTMAISAAYLQPSDGTARDPSEYAPEASRRARAFPIYAALRALGRAGLQELVDRCCSLARRFADRLRDQEGMEVLNEVVLNQVLVRFTGAGSPAEDDERTRAVIAAVQRDGTMWAGGTVWHGVAAMRISVSSWSTTEADVDRCVDAIVRLARPVGARATSVGS
jgi:glutamate/tyrosine decarboxylase-like PLP-dependent enzyme